MKKDREKKKKTCTYIGGQAVMEGVMMRGRRAMATAVRDPDGNVQIEAVRIRPPEERSRFSRLPFVRGVVSFVESLVVGNRVLMRSAEVAEGDPEQPSKAEKWLAEKHKVNVNSIWNGVAIALGILLAVLIFILVPQYLTGLTGFATTGLEGLWFNLIEGGIRLVIFLLYIVGISAIRTLGRVYRYHGAEHKTITCFERGLPLTVENVRTCSRVHDRCGTTFLFLVMVVSILVFSLANALVGTYIYTGNRPADFFIRLVFKLLMLPVVAGVSYEILRALAKTQSKFFLIFKAPGLLLQRITTREPDDGMIECAIAAFQKVYDMDADPSVPETVFATACKMSELLANTKKRFRDNGVDEEDAEWIFSLLLDIPKSAVCSEERILRIAQVKEILRIADERLTGRPLWYIIGDADFCGYKIKVDERVLIPRPETEELVQQVVAAAEEGNSILDLCTGSGAIAVAVYKELEKNKRKASVTASDISEEALALAKENAEENGADIAFVQSDLFSRIRGRFDIIVCNPPYIPSGDIAGLQREVRDFEPRLALDGGADGLDYYRRIAEDAGKYLVRGGMLVMEVGLGEAESVVKLFRYCDYSMVVKDFNGIDRFVKIVF
ncbi:MAG TPA: peptide chain release factor N(5)-glutamine methyltransferase [Candidatus Scatosoma pullicola]|nr:peptide chain release factor N(5)-glutamine methyltransferase [Candidatus Scatosoma pullicola]